MPIAALPPSAADRNMFGETQGNNPQLTGNQVNTDLPGTDQTAPFIFAYFVKKAGGNPLANRYLGGITINQSTGIVLRRGVNGGDNAFRIEIPPNTFNLNVRENILLREPGKPKC